MKEHSWLWVVFVYVLGGGVIGPFVACGLGLIPLMFICSLPLAYSTPNWVFQSINYMPVLLGVWGGAAHVLFRMRREVHVKRPSRCAVASVFVFALLYSPLVLGEYVGVTMVLGVYEVFAIGLLVRVVWYAAAVGVFALLTVRGFARMEAEQGCPA